MEGRTIEGLRRRDRARVTTTTATTVATVVERRCVGEFTVVVGARMAFARPNACAWNESLPRGGERCRRTSDEDEGRRRSWMFRR